MCANMNTTGCSHNSMATIARDDVKLGKVLGSGGFGAVHHGLWKSQNKVVAVKKLWKADFHEIEVLSQLQHPNIVTLYGFVNEDGEDVMIVMELCELGSLRSFLEQRVDNPLTLPLIHEWMFQAALPIDFLRHHKIQHMDIKTENYIITSRMVLKLTDFGLSQILEKTRSFSSEAGSWRWMPPERLREHKLSPKFDIYALALVLWCLFTRVLPYAEYPTLFSVAEAVCMRKVRPKIPPDCPKPIASLIQACWHDDRTKRPDIRDVIVVLAHLKAKYDNSSEGHSLTQNKPEKPTPARRSHKYRDASTQTAFADGEAVKPRRLAPPPPSARPKPTARNVPSSKARDIPLRTTSKLRVKPNDRPQCVNAVPPDATELSNVPPPLPPKGPRLRPKLGLPSVIEDEDAVVDPYYTVAPSVPIAKSLMHRNQTKKPLPPPPRPYRPDKGLYLTHHQWVNDKPAESQSPRRDGHFPTISRSGIYEHMTIQQQAVYKAKELNYSYLHVGHKLADRLFGAVFFGTYQYGAYDYLFPVTVQTDGGVVIDETDRLKEVRILSGLEHPNILRMIGFCEGEGEFTGHTVLIVLEHTAVGPLNKHLRKRSDVGVQDVLKLMLQVAEAMRYLNEKVNVVHRDVAARNILLVDDDHAKISNFQLATVMRNKEYRTDSAGKLIPLRWYAPECIYDLTFSSKSDVWGYGIALWEALSYGKRPYSNMRTNEVMPFLKNDKRLPKPERCSTEIYELMQRCWSWDPSDRPSFLDIIVEMEGILYE